MSNDANTMGKGEAEVIRRWLQSYRPSCYYQSMTLREKLDELQDNYWHVDSHNVHVRSLTAHVAFTVGRMGYGQVERIPIRNPYGKTAILRLLMNNDGNIEWEILEIKK